MLCNLGDVSLVIDYYVNTYSYERVKIIIQRVVLEFARSHVCGSQGIPDKDWVLRVLSEVGGNEDVCIEECIRCMSENQQVDTRLFPFKDLYETEEIVSMYSDERVGAILRLVVHEFAQYHLCGSQGIPKMSWVRRILSEVGGNDDECVIECINRMIALQEIGKRGYDRKFLCILRHLTSQTSSLIDIDTMQMKSRRIEALTISLLILVDCTVVLEPTSTS